MKEVNCDIIKDLLPGYIDKTTSESTNKLVIDHLQKCKNCSIALADMNTDINSELLFKQNEQIDYLKGFRKDKITSIIKAILISIIIILVLFLFLQEVVSKFEFFVDINNLHIEYQSEEKMNESTMELVFQAIDKKFNLDFKYEETNGKDIYIEPVGKFTYWSSPSRTYFFANINENTERVFLKDKKGNIKEIWNKDNGILVDNTKNKYELK